jgi:glutathione synthase/RimK-type ligase-like ATP-grasp enzyme
MFEDKILQYQNLSPAGVRFPQTVISRFGDLKFSDISSTLGLPFVVQFARGHTGSGTHIINDEGQFNSLQQEFVQRTVRIGKYIKGIPYTVNACITKKGMVAAGLCYQITGVTQLTPLSGGTVGNDWNYRKGFTEDLLKDLIDQLNKISNKMREAGFLGMFGIDLIIGEDSSLYIIEVNARQPASIPMLTKMQLKAGEIPLSLIHLLEFMNIDYNLDEVQYNQKNLMPADFAASVRPGR